MKARQSLPLMPIWIELLCTVIVYWSNGEQKFLVFQTYDCHGLGRPHHTPLISRFYYFQMDFKRLQRLGMTMT
jgi:hypothetical protein